MGAKENKQQRYDIQDDFRSSLLNELFQLGVFETNEVSCPNLLQIYL